MIKPMLAVTMDKVSITNWNDWAVEQKFDGWRVVLDVRSSAVQAWTRPRRRANGDKSMALIQLPGLPPGQLPAHLHEVVASLPSGIYDGELLGGTTSTDVGSRKHQSSLRLVVFDVLERHGQACMNRSYDERRRLLKDLFIGGDGGYVILAQSINVTSAEDVKRVFAHVREDGGEGVMLKRRSASYQSKRSKDVVKMKNLATTVCTVIGFEPTRGKVLKRGEFATVILEDADGNPTSVKTVDDDAIAAFMCQAHEQDGGMGVWVRTRRPLDTTQYPKKIAAKFRHAITGCHPAIGRKLRIEYQDWTPTGGYRHPRWDRWEEE